MEDTSFEDSLMESACIDDIIFYGPMTTYEEKVRKEFEKRLKQKKARAILLMAESSNTKKSGIPRFESSTFKEHFNETVDQSMFESFALEESHYDSFDDSLDEEEDGNIKKVNAVQFLSDQVRDNCVKAPYKQKCVINSLCDSLDDIHSLVSHAEKFSVSEEIEDVIFETNVYDDSLKNDNFVKSKNINSSTHCDDDSLAILDLEKAFDDSLEDNVLPLTSSVDDAFEREKNIDAKFDYESKNKNLLDTSVAIIYENVMASPNVKEETNYEISSLGVVDDRFSSTSENMISKDSLEEQCPTNTNLMPPDDPISSSSSIYLSASDDLAILQKSDFGNCNKKLSGSFEKDVSILENIGKFSTDQITETHDCLKTDDSVNISTALNLPSKVFSSQTVTNKCEISHENEAPFIDDSVIVLDSTTDFSTKYQNCDLLNNIEDRQNETSFKVPFVKVEDKSKKLKYNEFSGSIQTKIKMEDQNETIVIDDSFSAPCIKMENISNETIIIDDSFVLPCIKMENDLEENKCSLPLEQSPLKVAEGRGSTGIENIRDNVDSLLKQVQSAAFQKTDSKLTLQLEVAFDKEGINIVSISPLKVADGQFTKGVSELSKNIKSADRKNSCDGVSNTVLCAQTSPKCTSNGAISRDVQGMPDACDVQLLKALDLHDSSIIHEMSSVQSRDSIMPLNLCTRDEFQNRMGHITMEEKENIPCDFTVLKSATDKKKKLSFDNPKNATPKQFVCHLESTKNGSKPNSATKIPTRKFDSRLPIPINKAALCTKSPSNIETPYLIEPKNPDYAKPVHSTDIIEGVKSCLFKDPKSPINVKTTEMGLKSPEIVKNSQSKEMRSPTKVKASQSVEPKSKVNAKNSQFMDLKSQINTRTLPVKDHKNPKMKPSQANPLTVVGSSCSAKLDEVSKKLHHFCLVRNSISKVPQLTPRSTSKKFRNVESPVAKYIRKPNTITPLKPTHRFDGNVCGKPDSGKVLKKGPVTECIATAHGSPCLKPPKKL